MQTYQSCCAGGEKGGALFEDTLVEFRKNDMERLGGSNNNESDHLQTMRSFRRFFSLYEYY